MDTQKLIQEAKARFKHSEGKIYLQEKWLNRLHFASQGGMWKVDQQFLSFLSCAPASVVMVDTYSNPVLVDTRKLLDEAWNIYNTAMNGWLQEWQNFQNLR